MQEEINERDVTSVSLNAEVPRLQFTSNWVRETIVQTYEAVRDFLLYTRGDRKTFNHLLVCLLVRTSMRPGYCVEDAFFEQCMQGSRRCSGN